MSTAQRSNPTPLRTGWTTGACATAAARAAWTGVCTGAVPVSVTVVLPKGERPVFPILNARHGDGWAEATVEKDAGDDPDVTHGALITVRVERTAPGEGVSFHAGKGVGIVTKPGLPIGVGEPAINPVPRRMIDEAIADVSTEHGVAPDARVTVSVAGGAALALKTWNPRLGIEGGISILGTTGIVRPFSCSAWIASIHRGIDVAVATGAPHVVGATGSTSEGYVRTLYDLPDTAYLDMGDFVGGLLKYLRRHPVPRITVAGGPGKMTKLAQGALDLHSKRSQVDLDALAVRTGIPDISKANTALEAFGMGSAALARAVCADARATVRETLRGADIAVETIIVGRSGEPLARCPFDASGG